jgi:hypothetical protein
MKRTTPSQEQTLTSPLKPRFRLVMVFRSCYISDTNYSSETSMRSKKEPGYIAGTLSEAALITFQWLSTGKFSLCGLPHMTALKPCYGLSLTYIL